MTLKASTDREASAAIYRKAAKLMEEEAIYYDSPVRFACYALELAEFGYPMAKHSSFCAPMKAVFAPNSENTAWLTDLETASLSPEGRKDVRILALCFMAAVTERP